MKTRTKLTVFLASIAAIIVGCTTIPTAQNSNEIIWLEQGWSDQERQRYHHTSQGTMTLPIPYEWFAALEQPGVALFGSDGLLIENGYLERLGFISGEVTQYNQADLPVGFSVDYNVTNPAISKTPFNAIGLTCAACHTGQMKVGDKSIRYDGGPAMTNLTELTTVLGVALIETYISKVRFDRFAQRVLGITNTPKNQKKLKAELKHTLKNLVALIIGPDTIQSEGITSHTSADVSDSKFLRDIKLVKSLIDSKKATKPTVEGFTRLDALNRIGNTVFGIDTGNFNNVAVIDAPVNYPHIWNTSWFMWVQYDGSIMGPMIRNAGEAMGVAAYVTLDKNSPNNFESSVKLADLHWMETLLAGKEPPSPKEKRFHGLQHPKWDEKIFGAIDKEKHAKGARLYAKMCQSCHLPPIDNDAFWSDKFWTQPNKAGQRYLDVPMVDLDYIGTDPQQASILPTRTVNTDGIGLDTYIYLESKDWITPSNPVYYGARNADKYCDKIHVTDDPKGLYATALGATVQEVNNYWYKAHNTSPSQQAAMNGHRRNCLRAAKAYKARPLNGIWATAPFLHNGSVPNLYDLLSPVAERPSEFYLGSLDFDVKKIGYSTAKADGYFLLKTSKKGNSNKGHEFSDEKAKGVIGRKLSEEERYQLIEYLKDIKTVN